MSDIPCLEMTSPRGVKLEQIDFRDGIEDLSRLQVAKLGQLLQVDRVL